VIDLATLSNDEVSLIIILMDRMRKRIREDEENIIEAFDAIQGRISGLGESDRSTELRVILNENRASLDNMFKDFMRDVHEPNKTSIISFETMNATGASCLEGFHWDFDLEECVADE
jgi:hypothetical protein